MRVFTRTLLHALSWFIFFQCITSSCSMMEQPMPWSLSIISQNVLKLEPDAPRSQSILLMERQMELWSATGKIKPNPLQQSNSSRGSGGSGGSDARSSCFTFSFTRGSKQTRLNQSFFSPKAVASFSRAASNEHRRPVRARNSPDKTV